MCINVNRKELILEEKHIINPFIQDSYTIRIKNYQGFLY